MIWIVTSVATSFALGCAAMRKWPQDGALGALADLAEMPFLFLNGLKEKHEEKKDALPSSGGKQPGKAA